MSESDNWDNEPEKSGDYDSFSKEERITLRLYFKHRTDKATLYSTQQIGHKNAVDVWIPLSLTSMIRKELPATPFVLAKHIVEIPAWFYLKESALHSAALV